MKTRRTARLALLAATALAASGGVVAHAAVAPPASMTTPTEIHGSLTAAADEPSASPQPAIGVKTLAMAAAATAALAGLVRLFGFRRIADAVENAAPRVAKAASAAASAPLRAARAVGRAAASPFRFMMWLIGLAIFALTGFALFDVEWAGGLAAGAGMTALAWLGAAKTRRVFAPIRIRPRAAPFSQSPRDTDQDLR